jgi:O-methyltransferase
MSVRRTVVDFLIVTCKLKKLHGGRLQRYVRSFLDEIDFQNFREAFPCPSMRDREEMFEIAFNSGPTSGPITYLEFGVYTGESIMKWARLSTNRESRFFGFDSFEGLPEEWNHEKPKGYFSVSGKIPVTNDNRITFVPGWFEETVPAFFKTFTPKGRLVVHFDADLYSSTLLPLIYLDPFFEKGTLLLFDEFYDRDNEYKALIDYGKVKRRRYRHVCEFENFKKVCLQII